jgi:hypothetical protein
MEFGVVQVAFNHKLRQNLCLLVATSWGHCCLMMPTLHISWRPKEFKQVEVTQEIIIVGFMISLRVHGWWP